MNSGIHRVPASHNYLFFSISRILHYPSPHSFVESRSRGKRVAVLLSFRNRFGRLSLWGSRRPLSPFFRLIRPFCFVLFFFRPLELAKKFRP